MINHNQIIKWLFLLLLLQSFSVSAQLRRVEFSQGFSFGVSNLASGSDVYISKDQFTSIEDLSHSLGSGNHSSFKFYFKHDSNAMEFYADFQFLFGKTVLKNRIIDDSLNTRNFTTRTSFQVVSVFGLSYPIVISKRIQISPMVGLAIPILTNIREKVGFEMKNGNYTHAIYSLKTTFSPGFQTGLKISCQISDKTFFSTGLDFQFMNPGERKSKLKSMESNQYNNLEEAFPTISDREFVYHKELSDIQNDPVINPDNFDPNKPSDRLSAVLPMSRLIWWFGVAYKF